MERNTEVQWLGGGMSTRAVQRSMGPWPLQVSVMLPAAVSVEEEPQT
ncbi:MAG: hypothetical protein WAL95_18390 [Candidatus Acidiferrales bacterium]